MSKRPPGWIALVAGFFGIFAAACIMRAAPSATAPGATAAPAPTAATRAAEDRIAGLPRVDLLGGAGIAAFKVQGEAQKVDLAPLAVAGQPFTDAVRATVKQGSDHEWAVQLEAPNAAPVESGDAILATFYLRTETPQEGGVGETEFVFELNGSPYTKSIQYPVDGEAGWQKVEVRFKAAATYPAGGAHAIFRLGYGAQTIEIGGAKVEDFGKQIAYTNLPSTQTADRKRARAADEAAKAAAAKEAALPPIEGGDLPITVSAGEVIRPISPYVYGINSQPFEGVGATVRRMGGNRQTAYNWELNASNAGSDYNQSSDNWPCTAMGYTDCNVPGAQFIDFGRQNRKAGLESIATVPLVDYVTADERGSVPEAEKAPSKRWDKSVAHKPGPFTTSPDLSDGVVYEDEFVNALVAKLGKAADGGIKFYSLDNEPALWPSTHPRVHPDKTTYAEMISRTEATAGALLKVDPGAFVLGAVAYGWAEYKNLQDAPDAAAHNEKYGSYLDFFLASMKKLEEKHHQRLVHALDIHWYPEARGAKRITDNDNTPKTVDARVQAPRSLWDPSYVEKSWIAAELGGKPIRLIPWLQEKIAARYPGTKLSMTEYDFGGGTHVSGGLAQAEVLGVLGREGVYLANYWGNGPGNGQLPSYVKAAFQIYRNYDGHGGVFGDTAVAAAPADLDKAAVFAATDSKRPGTLTVLVINREQRTAFNGKIALQGGNYAVAKVFSFDGTSSNVRPLSDAPIANNQLSYHLPPLSATLFVCSGR
ncbi:MAG TPA: glycoside hydrolase family 44 protein [Polyangia bacterium]|nr:glycoside hydrolase family 44 protein [Polyangia bacterium]